jgi:hypothetical protein
VGEDKRIPPQFCSPVEKDLEILEKMRREGAVSIIYVGTVASGSDYRDLYLVLMPDRVPHIVSVRRICPGEKVLLEAFAEEAI